MYQGQYEYKILMGLTTKHGQVLDQVAIDAIKTEAGTALGFCSIVEQTGYWSGGQERSLQIIHIGTEGKSQLKVEELAKKLCTVFSQESVYVTRTWLEVLDVRP